MNFGPIPAPPQPAPSERIAVPPGTILFVRMNDTLDTSSAYTGQVFTATLATDLAAEGYVVARMGTTVYGQVLEANSARRGSGTSQLSPSDWRIHDLYGQVLEANSARRGSGTSQPKAATYANRNRRSRDSD